MKDDASKINFNCLLIKTISTDRVLKIFYDRRIYQIISYSKGSSKIVIIFKIVHRVCWGRGSMAAYPKVFTMLIIILLCIAYPY